MPGRRVRRRGGDRARVRGVRGRRRARVIASGGLPTVEHVRRRRSVARAFGGTAGRSARPRSWLRTGRGVGTGSMARVPTAGGGSAHTAPAGVVAGMDPHRAPAHPTVHDGRDRVPGRLGRSDRTGHVWTLVGVVRSGRTPAAPPSEPYWRHGHNDVRTLPCTPLLSLLARWTASWWAGALPPHLARTGRARGADAAAVPDGPSAREHPTRSRGCWSCRGRIGLQARNPSRSATSPTSSSSPARAPTIWSGPPDASLDGAFGDKLELIADGRTGSGVLPR